jgi:hypothetical protein
VSLAQVEPEDPVQVDAGIHAGDDRQAQRGRGRQLAGGEDLGVAFGVSQKRVDAGVGRGGQGTREGSEAG